MQFILKVVINFVLTLVMLALPGIMAKSAIALPLIAQTSIHANLTDPSGASSLQGQLTATEVSVGVQGVQIEARLENVPPGLHGFHIHEGSSCAENGNAAKGHFNPDGVKHGYLLRDGFANAHAGDLGNILIYPDGHGGYHATVPGLSLTEGKYAIANHAIILHAGADDLKTQPTGNAGGRIGCGVLE